MTRKRFMRLVMARGIQRNEAARMAQNVAAFSSYDRLYAHYGVLLAFRPLSTSLRKFGRAVEKAAKAFGDSFAVFKAAFVGIDLAAGEDQTVHVIHHGAGGGLEAMTREEHEAAHAAGRRA